MLKVITGKAEWKAVLDQLDTFDFYHTYDYHQLSKTENEQPFLLVYECDASLVAIPFFKRKIFETEFFDLTSAYGYVGPLLTEISDTEILKFQKELIQFLTDSKIVSIFSRLNPYIPNQICLLDGLGEIKPLGKVVNIDLTNSIELQRQQYRRDTKSRVNKARRACSIVSAKSNEDLDAFISIYTETMEKLDANSSYFFDKKYFKSFMDSSDFDTEILLAIHNETGEAAAASMFVKTNNIIQYHLSGTRSSYFKLAPSRVLLDEMRILATDQGFEFFNLGGGYQSKEDALFEFKASFSKDHKMFHIWKYVVNEDIYEQLVKKQQVNSNTDFFPAYRSN